MRLVTIGFVSNAHGLKGEVKITPVTIVQEVFQATGSFFMAMDPEHVQKMDVERIRKQGNRFIAKLSGVSDRSSAESLRNAQVQISENDILRFMKKYGIDYAFCEGYKVYNEVDGFIGEVKSVLRSPGQDVLVIKAGGKEVLIPAVPFFIKRTDLEAGRIIIHQIEGLVEANED